MGGKGRSFQEYSGRDTRTEKKNSASSAPACTTGKTVSLDPPKRGRPRGRPSKRKKAIGGNREDRLMSNISAMPEESSEVIATSDTGKIKRGRPRNRLVTTCRPSAELHHDEAGRVGTALAHGKSRSDCNYSSYRQSCNSRVYCCKILIRG